MKIRYSVSKNKEGLWIVWKEVETHHAISIRGVYSSPSKIDCYKYKKKVGDNMACGKGKKKK